MRTLPISVIDEAMELEAVRAWQDLLAVTPAHVRQAVADVVREGAEVLTEEFYERMMRNDRASPFLDQERVQKRLRASLHEWMTSLFAMSNDLRPAIRRQIEVGAVHARIRLPIDLIPSGIRILKRGIRRRIDFTPLDTGDRLLAAVYVSDVLHLADGLMNHAYFHDAQDAVRNDEAYRQVTQKRGAAFERARQRAALSEWAEGLLMSVLNLQAPRVFRHLRDSEFGIWVHHKGRVLFDDSDDFPSLLEAINTMDQRLLPRLQEAGQDRQRTDSAVAAIRGLLDLIRFKLNELFDQTIGRSDGFDQETQLPDRRYLPAILANVMRAHNQNGRPFCVLLVETSLPEFKGVQGATARARMLQVAVNTLVDCTRTSDHLFRYEEQRFLMVAVECDRGKAVQLANQVSEELRNALQTGTPLGSLTPVHTAVSIGIAEYDRHPDFQYLLQKAEAALTEASSGSRTRIASA